MGRPATPDRVDFLNQHVPHHRCSAVYELAGGYLRLLFLYGKRSELVPEFLQVMSSPDTAS